MLYNKTLVPAAAICTKRLSASAVLRLPGQLDLMVPVCFFGRVAVIFRKLAVVMLHIVWMQAFLISAAAAATEFTDIEGHWAEQSLRWAADNRIVEGYADGSLRPDQVVTEAEFLSMLFRSTPVAESTYGATKTTNKLHWADSIYESAFLLNYPVAGTADAALRDQPINRLKVAEILAGAYGYRYQGDDAVRFVLANGLASGKESATVEGFHPQDSLTRGEAVEFIRRTKVRAACRPPEPALTVLKVRPDALQSFAEQEPVCKSPDEMEKEAPAPVNPVPPEQAELPAEQAVQSAAAPDETAKQTVYFRVHPGDTLYAISRMFDTSVRSLAEANGLENPDVLAVGQMLVIPDVTLPIERRRVVIDRVLYSTLTAYTAGEESTGKQPSHPAYGITASGSRVRENHTVAVDPSVIPFGTEVYIEGIGVRTAEDRGAAVTGAHIDIFMNDLAEARQFGVKYGVKVYVIAQ